VWTTASSARVKGALIFCNIALASPGINTSLMQSKCPRANGWLGSTPSSGLNDSGLYPEWLRLVIANRVAINPLRCDYRCIAAALGKIAFAQARRLLIQYVVNYRRIQQIQRSKKNALLVTKRALVNRECVNNLLRLVRVLWSHAQLHPTPTNRHCPSTLEYAR
jgi:hypothetical protein